MKIIRMFFLLTSTMIIGCVNQPVNSFSFGNVINYEFPLKIKEIKKSGDFLVLLGNDNEKIVISENFLNNILDQITPAIDSATFFDLVFKNNVDNKATVPSQVLDFRNGLLDEKVIHKIKKNKKNSIIYLWELEGGRFKAIEMKKDSNYFLNIYVENYSKTIFLAGE